MQVNYQEIFQGVLNTIVTGALTALAAFLIALIKKGFNWLNSKVDSIESGVARDNVGQAMEVLQEVVTNVVTSLQQTTGDDIKKSIENGDGQFTKEDLLNLKQIAVNQVFSLLNSDVLKPLESVYDNLTEAVEAMVETQVRKLKENPPSQMQVAGLAEGASETSESSERKQLFE